MLSPLYTAMRTPAPINSRLARRPVVRAIPSVLGVFTHHQIVWKLPTASVQSSFTPTVTNIGSGMT
jgi:hypothetical protein